MKSNKFISLSAVAALFLLVLSACGTDQAKPITLQGAVNVKWAGSQWDFSLMDGSGVPKNLVTDIIRVTVTTLESADGPVGIVIFEDTNMVEVDYTKMEMLGKVASSGFELNTNRPGATEILSSGAVVYTLENASCSPYVLKNTGKYIEVWVQKGCSHRP